MININGIQVDITTSADSLSNKMAIFIVEFEFDNRPLVCHALNQSIFNSIKCLLSQILSKNAKNIELRRALLNSRYITINVEKYGFKNERELLAYKYELIKANKAYSPHGYNNLIKAGNALEQNYANILTQELIQEIDKNALYLHGTLCTHKKNQVSKRVYSYDKQTKLLVKEYASIKEAAESTNICASNISMCCNGHIKTAGPYIWSFTNKSIVEK